MHTIYRIFFAGAFVLAALCILEKASNVFIGLTFMSGYSPWRLLELSAFILLFVIALELRDIRNLQGNKP